MIRKKANLYCKKPELIENYFEAINDLENYWEIHHRKEIQDDGTILSRKELISMGLYYNVSPNDLIFLTEFEHKSLHGQSQNRKLETLKKMSESKTGANNPMYGVDRAGEKNPFYGYKHSEESKEKISNAMKRYWANRNNK